MIWRISPKTSAPILGDMYLTQAVRLDGIEIDIVTLEDATVLAAVARTPAVDKNGRFTKITHRFPSDVLTMADATNYVDRVVPFTPAYRALADGKSFEAAVTAAAVATPPKNRGDRVRGDVGLCEVCGVEWSFVEGLLCECQVAALTRSIAQGNDSWPKHFAAAGGDVGGDGRTVRIGSALCGSRGPDGASVGSQTVSVVCGLPAGHTGKCAMFVGDGGAAFHWTPDASQDSAVGDDVAPKRYISQGRETVDRMRDRCREIAAALIARRGDRAPYAVDTLFPPNMFPHVAGRPADRLGDYLFTVACETHVMKYRDRHGRKDGEDPSVTEAKAAWWADMVACMRGEGVDPRAARTEGPRFYVAPVSRDAAGRPLFLRDDAHADDGEVEGCPGCPDCLTYDAPEAR